MLKEFKAFVMRGNVVDLAVGVIIGSAFGKIVSSLVTDILMPPVGAILGGVDFRHLVLTLKEGSETVKPITLNYGLFINTVIDFLIVAVCIFGVVKAANRLKKKDPVPEPTEKSCPQCLMIIPKAAKKCGHCASAI